MKFSNPKRKYRLGGEWIESSPEEKDWGELVDVKLGMSGQHAFTAQKTQFVLGCIKTQSGLQVKSGDSPPLLCPHEIFPGVHPVLGSPVERGHQPVEVRPEERH
ncbi:hypothetical protein TURU_017538 [Turdus rufiventris]|nr:hypothetical protein TURU_017538 [Turdus rufiventris]